MTTRHRRLDSLYAALTAKERALLVLRASKEGGEPHEEIYDNMPDGQAAEFNHLMRMLRVANGDLRTGLLLLRERIGALRLSHDVLQTTRLWAIETGRLRVLLAIGTREPVTATEHAELVAAARQAWIPLRECVRVVLETHDWSDEDYVNGAAGGRDVSRKAWGRRERETRELLNQLIARGALPSRRRGRAVEIRAGEFYDWHGAITPVFPDTACEYEVRPDDEADRVHQDRDTQASVRAILDRAPKLLADPSKPVPFNESTTFWTEFERARVKMIHDLLKQNWSDGRAIEVVLREWATAWFDDEDILEPPTRALLEGCLTSCLQLRDDMKIYGEIDLTEPTEEDLDEVRGSLDRLIED